MTDPMNYSQIGINGQPALSVRNYVITVKIMMLLDLLLAEGTDMILFFQLFSLVFFLEKTWFS